MTADVSQATALAFRPEAQPDVSAPGSWVLAGLLAVLGIGLVLALRSGRLRAALPWSARPGSARILSTLEIGGGARVVELQHGGRILLLGVTAHQVSLLESSELPHQGAEQ